MRLIKGTLLCLLFIITITFPGETSEEIDRILENINTLNRFSGTYRANIQIASFKPDEEPVVSAYIMYFRSLDNVLLVQKKPQKDTGKKILLKNDKIWFYFPAIQNAIIINPTGALNGTVAIGDVISPPILDLYDLDSWDGKEDYLKLTFRAVNLKSPYGSMVYYYSDGKVIESESYTRSGIMLKRAVFEEYAKTKNGDFYATKIRMESSVNEGHYSLIKLSDLEELDFIPNYYFVVEGLSRVEE